jgi:hypothetical protein
MHLVQRWQFVPVRLESQEAEAVQMVRERLIAVKGPRKEMELEAVE